MFEPNSIPGLPFTPASDRVIIGPQNAVNANAFLIVALSSTANLSAGAGIGTYRFGDALVLDWAVGKAGPTDGSGQLEILGARLYIYDVATSNAIVDVGIPFATFTAPLSPLPVISGTPITLLATSMAKIEGAALPLNLQMVVSVDVKNLDAGAPHQLEVQVIALFRKMSGLSE
jgi:hypothetical protein